MHGNWQEKEGKLGPERGNNPLKKYLNQLIGWSKGCQFKGK